MNDDLAAKQSEFFTPKSLVNRRSSRLQGQQPPLSPSHYLSRRPRSLDSSTEKFEEKSPVPIFPKSSIALVQETCDFLRRNQAPNSSSGSGKPNSVSNFTGNLNSNNFQLTMTSANSVLTSTPSINTSTSISNQTLTSQSLNSQIMNPGQFLQLPTSPFSDYIEVPKSLILESFKFYGTQNDHSTFKENDDRDPYITATKWLTYLEQRVTTNELARLSLAKATARGPARAIILDYASNSAPWQEFKTKVIERYTRRDFQDSAIKVAEIFSAGRKKNQSYEIFINEILNTLQEIQNYNPNLFTPIGLTKSLFLASIPATLRHKFDTDKLSIPECIKKLEQQLDQNRDRFAIDHRASADELLYIKRSGIVEQKVPLEGANAVMTVRNHVENEGKGNIFQGTRLVKQENSSGSSGANVSANRGQSRQVYCYNCNQPNHFASNCTAPRVPSGRNYNGQGGNRGRGRGFRGNYRENRSGRGRGARGPPHNQVNSVEPESTVQPGKDENANQLNDPNVYLEDDYYGEQ